MEINYPKQFPNQAPLLRVNRRVIHANFNQANVFLPSDSQYTPGRTTEELILNALEALKEFLFQKNSAKI